MSRRLVIGILAVLIIGVIGGTAVLVISRLRGLSPQATETSTDTGSLQEADTGSQQIVDPNGDSDGDGLTNSEEALWGTSTFSSDTDGDGFLDGEEVKANHNPTIASPNDVLPEGFVPGKEITPLQSTASQEIAIDQFFVDSINIPNVNLTDEYKNRYPEEEQTSDTLWTYVNEQTIQTKLPQPAEKSINLASSNTAANLSAYLNIVGTLDSISNKTLLASAIRSLFQEKDSSGFIDLEKSSQSLQERLIAAAVPPAAENAQRLLLGYTELLRITFAQIKDYNNDQVEALVALRQLEENDKVYYPLIQQEINKLRALQSQLSASN